MQVFAEQEHFRNRLEQMPQRCIEGLTHGGPARNGSRSIDSSIGQRRGAEDVRRHLGVACLRRGLGPCSGLVHEAYVARLDTLPRRVGQSTAQRGKRIPAADLGHLFTGAQVITFAVRPHAARIDYQEAGTSGCAYRDHDVRDLAAELRVVIGQMPCCEPEGSAALLDAAADGLPGVSGLRDAVVLHNDEQRRLPHRREIHALVHQTLTERAVADHRRHQRTAAALLARQGEARADTHHAGLHAVAVKLSPREMLAAAASATNSVLAPHDLRDQAWKVARIGQKVTVVAVIGQDCVFGVIQRAHDRKGGKFLPEAGVRGSRNESA